MTGVEQEFSEQVLGVSRAKAAGQKLAETSRRAEQEAQGQGQDSSFSPEARDEAARQDQAPSPTKSRMAVRGPPAPSGRFGLVQTTDVFTAHVLPLLTSLPMFTGET